MRPWPTNAKAVAGVSPSRSRVPSRLRRETLRRWHPIKSQTRVWKTIARLVHSPRACDATSRVPLDVPGVGGRSHAHGRGHLYLTDASSVCCDAGEGRARMYASCQASSALQGSADPRMEIFTHRTSACFFVESRTKIIAGVRSAESKVARDWRRNPGNATPVFGDGFPLTVR